MIYTITLLPLTKNTPPAHRMLKTRSIPVQREQKQKKRASQKLNHGIEVGGYTEKSLNKEISKNKNKDQ